MCICGKNVAERNKNLKALKGICGKITLCIFFPDCVPVLPGSCMDQCKAGAASALAAVRGMRTRATKEKGW